MRTENECRQARVMWLYMNVCFYLFVNLCTSVSYLLVFWVVQVVVIENVYYLSCSDLASVSRSSFCSKYSIGMSILCSSLVASLR